jgi:hypothetical protein
MTRRDYLKSAAAALLGLFGQRAGAGAAISMHLRSAEDRVLKRRLEQLFSDTDSAKAVGSQYLFTFPGSAGGALDRVRALAASSRFHGANVSLGERIVSQCREDFASGESVIINGWVIARCEADLCAALVCLGGRMVG